MVAVLVTICSCGSHMYNMAFEQGYLNPFQGKSKGDTRVARSPGEKEAPLSGAADGAGEASGKLFLLHDARSSSIANGDFGVRYAFACVVVRAPC